MLTTKLLAEEHYSGKIVYWTGEPTYKPCAVVDYCHEMGGVDLTDQLLEYYHFLRRSCKWWRKLWVHLFNMVILNAFLLNKHFGLQKNLTQPEFRYLLAAALLDYTPLVDPPMLIACPSNEVDIGQNVYQYPQWPKHKEEKHENVLIAILVLRKQPEVQLREKPQQ